MNPLRATLAGRAEDWPWSSAHDLGRPRGDRLLNDGPAPRRPDWLDRLNRSEIGWEARRLESLHSSVACGRPFGDPSRVKVTAEAFRFLLTT